MVGRIPVRDIHPVVDLGRQSAKATLGEPLPIRATVFREGHDKLGAEVVLIGPDGVRRPPVRLQPVGPSEPDRYEAWPVPDAEGPWTFEVHAWSDPVATWRHAARLKIPAGVDTELMFTEGALILDRLLAQLPKRSPHASPIRSAIEACRDTTRPPEARLAALEDPGLTEALTANPLRELLTIEGPYPLYADRPRALFGSWYEFFPRSAGAYVDEKTGKVVSGTFRTATKMLDYVAQMGFDVVYLPPIHPIGEINRKGRNNTLDPEPDDTGSPWAIGSKDGGHDAIHPDLGTIEDFDAFVAHARGLGLEVALDLALQAAPDHPWVAEHPEFFTTRADGTIAYAENPPKKYQDIYPINFDNDPQGISAEVLRVVRHWMDHGVRIFRVDNPHTKPVAFWEWLLGEVRRTDPDVLFLSEAFTRPAMMHTLGAVGFQQSYTYFTWRNTKQELADYFTELATESDHVLRPNLFVNTPDILHEYLQYGGPAAFRIRAVLAATGAPSWGVYSGYELFEHVAVRPGSEEYLDSEKYQIRVRDYEGALAEGRSLAPYLALLNDTRRKHPALQRLRNLTVHRTDGDAILAYSKVAGNDRVIVVVNTDPHTAREDLVHLDLEALGLPAGSGFVVHDVFTGQDFTWGERNYVRLDPHDQPAHLLVVRTPGSEASQ